MLDRVVDEGFQFWWLLAAARVVEREAREGRRIRCQNALQPLGLDVRQHQLLKRVGQAIQCRRNAEHGGADGEIAVDLMLDDAAIDIQLPLTPSRLPTSILHA
jgi:hypothetical protein